MGQVSIFLADGFEEIEGLTVADLLRRAGISVDMVSITGERMIHGAHGIDIQADVLFEEMDFGQTELLVLPGGMPGTLHLQEHQGLRKLLLEYHEKKKRIAAICAAPSVLGGLGLLQGKRACCYPSFEEKLTGAQVSYDAVCTDGHIVTSRGMGTAIPFALELIALLCGKEKSEEVGKSILFL